MKLWRCIGSMALAALGTAGCSDEVDGEEQARARLEADTELACLRAYGHERDCLGGAAAGTPEAACPPGEPAELYDAFGPDCLRARIALWQCEASLECREAGCEAEAEAEAAACAAVVDGGGR